MQSRQFTKDFLAFYQMSKRKSSLKIVFLILTITIGIWGCRRQQPSHPVLPPDTGIGNIALQDETYNTDFGDYAGQYGTIVVPSNYMDSLSAKIELYFIRIHAQTPSQKAPIFYLGGGPGHSNLTFQPFQPLVADRDFVMVGYRGIDDSEPLICFNVQEAMAGEKDALGQRTRAKLADAFSECAGQLAGRGIDLNNYTIREVIEDIESVRMALGYDQMNLLSESYGTRIATFYAQQHPESLARSVMLGANPPGRFIFENGKIQQQLEDYAKLWRDDANNPARDVDLLATIRQVLDNPPSRWLIFPIDVGKVKMAAFLMLFHRQSAAMVFDAFLAAADGDASGLAVMSFGYDMLVPSSLNYADVAAKAVSADYDSSRDFVTEMASDGTLLGSPHAQLMWGSLQHSDWPKSVLPAPYTQLQNTDIQTLILSGNRDFSTPAEYARDDLLPYLPNGQQIVISEAGHTVDLWTLHNDAVVKCIVGFFDDGRIDADAIPYSPMTFAVGLGFAGAAKVAVTVVVLAFLFVTFMIAFLIYRWRLS